MMQNESVQYHPEWKSLYEYAKHWQYGELHTHDELLRIMGFTKKNTKYYESVQAVRYKLRGLQKILKTVKDKGYLVVMPDDCPEIARKRSDAVTAQIQDIVEEVASFPFDKMSLQAQIETRNISDRMLARQVAWNKTLIQG